jgi:hypothetical protein
MNKNVFFTKIEEGRTVPVWEVGTNGNGKGIV